MPHLNPTVVYEDHALVIVDKPAGLLSIPAGGEGRKDCLASRVAALYPGALIVHRLDMPTSGLVMFARGAEMLRRMNQAFARRMIGKRYQALVSGHIGDDEGEILLPLAPDPDRNPYHRVDLENGLKAHTRYRVIERGSGCCGVGNVQFSRVALELLTGRTHQLRVHLQAIGHAILGDPLYAPEESAGRYPRMYLHARKIAFIHPETQVPVQVESPVPF